MESTVKITTTSNDGGSNELSGIHAYNQSLKALNLIQKIHEYHRQHINLNMISENMGNNLQYHENLNQIQYIINTLISDVNPQNYENTTGIYSSHSMKDKLNETINRNLVLQTELYEEKRRIEVLMCDLNESIQKQIKLATELKNLQQKLDLLKKVGIKSSFKTSKSTAQMKKIGTNQLEMMTNTTQSGLQNNSNTSTNSNNHEYASSQHTVALSMKKNNSGHHSVPINVDMIDPRSLIGMKIRKKFGNQGYFIGTIMLYRSPYYRVKYEDNDREDLTMKQIVQYLQHDSKHIYPETEVEADQIVSDQPDESDNCHDDNNNQVDSRMEMIVIDTYSDQGNTKKRKVESHVNNSSMSNHLWLDHFTHSDELQSSTDLTQTDPQSESESELKSNSIKNSMSEKPSRVRSISNRELFNKGKGKRKEEVDYFDVSDGMNSVESVGSDDDLIESIEYISS